MKQEGYFERKMIPFANCHAEVGSQMVHYEAYEGGMGRTDAWFPGVEGNPWSLVDLFPGYSYNLRASVLRVDSQIPLDPNKTIVEYRSLGLKSDTVTLEDEALLLASRNLGLDTRELGIRSHLPL
jgi:methanesulfonate monooxygenase subunit alpha